MMKRTTLATAVALISGIAIQSADWPLPMSRFSQSSRQRASMSGWLN